MRPCRECSTDSYAGGGKCVNSKCRLNATHGQCAACGRKASGRCDSTETKWFYCNPCWSAYEKERKKRLREVLDAPDVLERKTRKLADLILASRSIIVFTGAGLSTGCGIPDFRSGPGTNCPTGIGVWEGGGGGDVIAKCLGAEPGSMHRLLARLVAAGAVKHVVTQNVDGLHRRAGVPLDQLSELHGNIFVERCERCGAEAQHESSVICRERFTGRNCACGGRFRDTGVRFGDGLPEESLDRAWAATERADLCIVLGSSCTVTPASEIPVHVARRGKLVVLNLQPTVLDDSAALRIGALLDPLADMLEPLLQKTLGPPLAPVC